MLANLWDWFSGLSKGNKIAILVLIVSLGIYAYDNIERSSKRSEWEEKEYLKQQRRYMKAKEKLQALNEKIEALGDNADFEVQSRLLHPWHAVVQRPHTLQGPQNGVPRLRERTHALQQLHLALCSAIHAPHGIRQNNVQCGVKNATIQRMG